MKQEPNLFEALDYRDYMRAKAGPEGTRNGMKQRMAKTMGCHSSYLTSVLRDTSHLSLEQSWELNKLFGHDDIESRYFMLLVQLSRAGTEALKKHFATQMKKLKAESFSVQKNIGIVKSLNDAAQGEYYLNWYYAAIHMATTVPTLRTKTEIAEYFQLPLSTVGEGIRTLEKLGLIELKNGKYLPTSTELHLPNTSPFIIQHHTHWKLRTIQSLLKEKDNDFHYSGVVTLSKQDATKIKKILLDSIQTLANEIKNSEEEEVFALGLDFYCMRGQN